MTSGRSYGIVGREIADLRNMNLGTKKKEVMIGISEEEGRRLVETSPLTRVLALNEARNEAERAVEKKD